MSECHLKLTSWPPPRSGLTPPSTQPSGERLSRTSANGTQFCKINELLPGSELIRQVTLRPIPACSNHWVRKVGPCYISKAWTALTRGKTEMPTWIPFSSVAAWQGRDSSSLLHGPVEHPISLAVSHSLERFHQYRGSWRIICVLHPAVCL